MILIQNWNEWYKAVSEVKKWQKGEARLSRKGKTARRFMRNMGLCHENNVSKVASETWKQYKLMFGIS